MKTSASTIVLLFAIVSATLAVLNALSEHNDGLAVGRNEESRALRERGAVRPNLRVPKEEHVTMHVEEAILVDDASKEDKEEENEEDAVDATEDIGVVEESAPDDEQALDDDDEDLLDEAYIWTHFDFDAMRAYWDKQSTMKKDDVSSQR